MRTLAEVQRARMLAAAELVELARRVGRTIRITEQDVPTIEVRVRAGRPIGLLVRLDG